jgi:hypothetical protein
MESYTYVTVSPRKVGVPHKRWLGEDANLAHRSFIFILLQTANPVTSLFLYCYKLSRGWGKQTSEKSREALAAVFPDYSSLLTIRFPSVMPQRLQRVELRCPPRR